MASSRLVPIKREEWSFFDRQRSIFSSMNKDMEKEWKDFDMELERIRKEMFTLTPTDSGMGQLTSGADFGNFGTDMDFGKMGSGMDFGKMGSGMDLMKSEMSKLENSAGFGNMNSNLIQVDKPFVTDMDGNKKLSIRFDVSQFKPEEISVKTMDNKLMIHAKHTEESPGRKVYREFSKQYVLPNKIDPLKLNSILSKDGVLNIEAPAPDAVEAPRERILPIQRL
ncbi:heat shock protein 27 [Patella vulgata]|uniref:heat shock protein 27 n=1 Tax=Patella vulgata TaxID=6465 RepID=UPI0024A99E52|nr:heat shock protein 27 [Patella vulgata]